MPSRPDARGIREVKVARWAGSALRLAPASYQKLAGIGTEVDASALARRETAAFRFDVRIAGSEGLRLLPLARETAARLRSSWPHPNFSAGTFLPARYALDASGFDAHWQVLQGAVAAVYSLLYLLVLSEQYALLLGALLVFAVLAGIMMVTRRLDWHALAARG